MDRNTRESDTFWQLDRVSIAHRSSDFQLRRIMRDRQKPRPTLEMLVRNLRALAGAALLGACTDVAPRLTPIPEYRGLRHPPLPAGTTHLAGYLLSRGAGVGYAVAHLQQADRELLLLNRPVGRDSTGEVRWETVEAVALPERDSSLVLALGTCGLGEAPVLDIEIIALVRPDQGKPVWPDVRAAWRADSVSGHFVSVPTDRIRCLDEGYDADGAR